MNKLLQLNKNTLIIILFLISLFILSSIVIKKTNKSYEVVIVDDTQSSFDMVNPRFTINNEKEKISVKAKNGNFIGRNIILLENDVLFKSINFQLSSNKVFFNQKDATAESDEFSVFKSDGTIIKSEGFKITENGDIILFNGKTILILNK